MKINFIRMHQAVTRLEGGPKNQLFSTECELIDHPSGVLATFPKEAILIPFANLPQVNYFPDTEDKPSSKPTKNQRNS